MTIVADLIGEPSGRIGLSSLVLAAGFCVKICETLFIAESC